MCLMPLQIGNVAAGGLFATLQSAAMGGAPVVLSGIGAAATAAGGAVAAAATAVAVVLL